MLIDFAMTGHDSQVFVGQGFIAAADPQSDSADAYPVKPGAWKVTLGSDGQSGDDANVSVWVRRTADGAFHGGVVDVNLFVVPGAASSTYMNQVLNAFFPYVGLEKGTVNTYSADSDFSTVNSRDEFYGMLAATAGVPSAPVINLFVVDNFADSDFGGAIGVAGGIPGSAMRNGTKQSGVAYEPSGDPGYDATILMHEIGHLGGLFHTTELQVVETDPLSDTASCPADTISNNPDACPDKSNVMFPMAYGATTFSTAQENVLHGSALYRGIVEQGGSPAAPLALVPSPGAPAPSPFVDPFAFAAAIEPAPRAMPSSPDALERILGALWCSHDSSSLALSIARDRTQRLSRDVRSSPASAAAPSASRRLRAIFLDDAAPILLRKRAMKLYLAAARDEGLTAEAIETVLAIARATGAASIPERRLRSAAIRLVRDARLAPIGSASPSLGTQLASRIDAALATALASADPLVAAAAAGE